MNIMRFEWLRAVLLFFSLLLLEFLCRSSASAATAWLFDGQCYNSHVKWGTLDEDLTKEAGDPIHCDKAVLIELRNGRKLINFTTGRGVLGFAGPGIDRQVNPTMAVLPIDRIYPIRDIQGMSRNEVVAGGAKREGALEGAEGFFISRPRTYR